MCLQLSSCNVMSTSAENAEERWKEVVLGGFRWTLESTTCFSASFFGALFTTTQKRQPLGRLCLAPENKTKNTYILYLCGRERHQNKATTTIMADLEKQGSELSNSDAETCETLSISTERSSDDDLVEPKVGSKTEVEPLQCSWRCCGFCGLVSIALLLWAAAGFYVVVFMEWPPNPIATCGECHCSVTEGSQCPSWVPVTEYSDYTIETLASQVATNPYTLSCNPYKDDECETSPPQDPTLTERGERAVCALHYKDGTTDNPVGAQYTMQSYADRFLAEAAGGFVTHAGACGVCSETQNLAAYLRSPDLTSAGKHCSLQGVLSFDMGVDCYRELGFTEACAEMWIYNGYHTKDACFWTCLADTFSANSGPAPQCALNNCLQCDEDHSGPLFKKFAARTRRRSGMLSAIVRPCDSLHQITHEAFPPVG